MILAPILLRFNQNQTKPVSRFSKLLNVCILMMSYAAGISNKFEIDFQYLNAWIIVFQLITFSNWLCKIGDIHLNNSLKQCLYNFDYFLYAQYMYKHYNNYVSFSSFNFPKCRFYHIPNHSCSDHIDIFPTFHSTSTSFKVSIDFWKIRQIMSSSFQST